MRPHKTKLAIIGLIMVLSIPIIMLFAYIRLFNFDSSLYLHVAIMILAGVGYILISLSYNWTLGAGAVLLAFGIDIIMAGSIADAYSANSSFNDPFISHFTKVGYLFIGIGMLLILLNIYSFLRRRRAKEIYYFFPRF